MAWVDAYTELPAGEADLFNNGSHSLGFPHTIGVLLARGANRQDLAVSCCAVFGDRARMPADYSAQRSEDLSTGGGLEQPGSEGET